jgi:hypothetical protein
MSSKFLLFFIPWQLSWDLPNPDIAKFSGWDSYDPSQTLVVEVGRTAISMSFACKANLCWSTYLGGNGDDFAHQIIKDSTCNFFIGGETGSMNFPYISGFQTIYGGIFSDGLIAKFLKHGNSLTNTNLDWATYYGGNQNDQCYSIAINKKDNSIYAVGTTNSKLLPMANSITGDFNHHDLNGPAGSIIEYDGFIAKFKFDGTDLYWSSYIGGSFYDESHAIAINNSNEVYVVGFTRSDSSASTPFPLKNQSNSYNQYRYGGTDDVNYFYGGDGFIIKFSGRNDSVLWSTYFGGDDGDWIKSLIFLNDDKLIISGYTNSKVNDKSTTSGQPCPAKNNYTFPICDPGGSSRYLDTSFNSLSTWDYDCFLACFDSSDQLIWSTYFGGSDTDIVSNHSLCNTYIASQKFYLIGTTNSPDSFPIKISGHYDQTFAGASEAFIASFENFEEKWCTYFGGASFESGNAITTDVFNNVSITGKTKTPFINFTCNPPIVVGEFPVCDINGGYWQGFNDPEDAYIATFNENAKLLWSTPIGGYFTGGSYSYEEGISLIADSNYIYLFGQAGHYDPIPATNSYPIVQFPGYLYDWFMSGGRADFVLSKFNMQTLVGVNENHFEIETLVFPNPAGDYVYIYLKSNAKNLVLKNDLSAGLFDIQGRKLKEVLFQRLNFNTFYAKVELSDISCGFYLIKVNESKISCTAKVIKL